MNLRRGEATDSGNVRSVITYLGLSLMLSLSLSGLLVYILSTRSKLDPEVRALLVPLLTGLGTISAVLVGALGAMLSRTSTVPSGATTNVVNAAPQGDPPSPTVNTTNIGGPPDGGAAGTLAPVTFGGSGGSSAGAAVTFTGDAPGVMPLG